MRIVLFGADGRFGIALHQTLTQQGHDVIGSLHKEPDIRQMAPVRAFVKNAEPDLVIHPAAWTDVDGCARDPDEAMRVNALGTQHIALACQQVGAPLCYISTNEVFDGTKTTPYLEYDVTRPINSYGYSKWVGEQVVLNLLPQHYIVRPSWMFAHSGPGNFLHAIRDRAQEGKPLRVVTDEIGSPTYVDDLCPALAQLITTERYGIYHLVNEGATSRYGFARHILDCYGFNDYPITPIVKAQWPRPSQPPTYGALRNFMAAEIGIKLRDWRDAVSAFVEREKNG